MKSSLYNHIRILLISLFTLVANGAAWGQTFGDPNSVSSSYTFKRYLKTSNATTTPIISDTEANELYSIIVSKLAEQASRTEAEEETILQNQAYVRWFISKDGVLQDMNPWEFRTVIRPNEQWPFTKHYIYGFYWFPHKDRWNDAVDVLLELLRIKSITNYSSLNLSNYNIELVVSDEADLSADVYNGYGGNWQGTEPTLKLRFIWEFNETGEAPVDPFENVPDDTPESTSEFSYYSVLSQPSVNIDLSNDNVHYVRWYIMKDGEVVDNEGWTLSSDDYEFIAHENTKSLYYYSSEEAKDLHNITVTPPSGVKLSDYQLVCLTSTKTDATYEELVTYNSEGQTMIKEPTITAKYIVTFSEKTFENLPDDLPVADTYNINVPEINTPSSFTIDFEELAATDWMPSITKEECFYARWYVTLNGQDNPIDISEWTIANNSYEYLKYDKSKYYHISDAPYSEESKSLLDMTITPPDGVDITDYQVVCLLSGKNDGVFENDFLVVEPKIEAKYLINFEKQTFNNVPEGVGPALNNPLDVLISDYTAQPITIDLKSKFTDQGSPLYVRVGLQKKIDNTMVPMDNWDILTVNPLNATGTYFNTKYYLLSEVSDNLLSWNVKSPDGIEITDYCLVLWVSTSTEGYDIKDNVLYKEPTIQNKYVVDFKKITFENVSSSPATQYSNVNIYDEQTYDNGVSTTLNVDAPFYVRWFWSYDGSTSTSDANGWLLKTKEGKEFNVYNTNNYYYYSTESVEDLKTIVITPPTGTDVRNINTNLKLVALVATSNDGAVFENVNGNNVLVKEPLITQKHIIQFSRYGFENVNNISSEIYSPYYVSEEESKGKSPVVIKLNADISTIISKLYKSTVEDLNNGFYIRWYIKDNNNNKLTGTDLTEWTLESENDNISYNNNKYGYYWFSVLNNAVNVSDNQNLMNLKITCPNGVNILDYKAECVIGTADNYHIVESKLVREPQCYIKYEFDFEPLTFEGNTANATQLSKTIRLEDSGKNTAALALDDSEYGVLMNNIDNEDARFYARWYVTDKSGEKVNIQGLSITHATNTLKNHEHGWYWYKVGAVTKEDLAVTVTAPEGTDLRDYNVVAVMSSYAPLEIDAEGNVVYEPRDLEVVYTYQIKKPISPDFDGYFTDNGIKKEVKVLIKEGMTSVTLNDLSADYGAGRLNNVLANPPVYRRFYIRNKETKALLDNQGNWITNTSSNTHFIINENGNLWSKIYTELKGNNWIYNQFNSNNNWTAVLQVAINPPSGYSIMDLKNYEVVGILSNSPEYEYDYTTDANNPQLTKGPEEYNVEYVFSFYTEDKLTFNHYKGITGRDWVTVDNNPLQGQYKNEYFDNGSYGETTDDIRQGTHEWTYEIYVKRGETVNLMLPFQNVEGDGQNLEPQGYFRWYDWNTDFMSSKITPYGDASNNKLKEMFKQTIDKKEISRGLFYWWNGTNILASAKNMAAVKFTAPTSESWTGDIIACDVSKYIDGLNADFTILNYEPTLSNRYKFVIRPAKDIADEIKTKIETGSIFEEHGNVTIGVTSTKAGTTSLRLNLSNVNNYYFYPCTISYDSNGKKTETWDTSQLIQATRIDWRVYDYSQAYYMPIGSHNTSDNGLFFNMTNANVSGTFNDCLAPNDYNKNKQINIGLGENFYVYAFATNGTHSAPIARFNCHFTGNSPVLHTSLEENVDYWRRTISYLEENYTRVGLISFDIEEGSNLQTPTEPVGNMNSMPFIWQRSFYGYCYPQLYSYMAGNASSYTGLSPLHGDYTILKSMNMKGVSDNGSTNGYKMVWWQTGLLQDLTHYYTGGNQSGYFLYVDASDESRPIANVEFEGEMCTGSTLVLSTMVADMTSASIRPQLMFKLYGIDTDINGNERSRKLIHSFATCDFSTVDAGGKNNWYQVFARVTLQNNTGVENYQRFLVSIDNYCNGTDGADYAIDDIRIYMQNSKVEVLQNSVLCSEANKATTATIRMKHETLKAMIPFETTDEKIPVYYRICKEDGTVVLGAYSKEMYLDFEEGYAANPELYFTDGNGERYFIIAEEQEFALDAKQKYYVSVAMPVKNTDSAPAEDSGAWGNPTSVCSMYSEPFEPLIQSLNLMVNGKGISRINIDCHKIDTRDEDLSITGALQVPDPETGELVSIDDPAMCSFDWVVEVKGEQTIITDAFRLALQHFRKEYYKGTDDKYYTAIQDAKGVFTDDDKTLLESAIASKKLYLCASSSLAGPIYKVGNTYTITAIPLETKLYYKGKDYDVCPSPMEVVVEARLNGPELNLGFEGVNYESVGMEYGADGLRVGKAQLENMQQNDVPLHLPISSYKQLQIENGEEYYKVISEYNLTLDDFDVIIWDSNDPTWKSYLSSELDLFGTEGVWTIGGEASHKITNKNKSIELELHTKFIKKIFHREEKEIDGATVTVYSVQQAETEIPIVFHEGYWYKVKVRYSTTEDAENNEYLQRCFGETYFTIKVVPEYVTWDKGLAANSNWLNDDNWNRSVKKDLYKDDYVNNGEGVLAEQVVDGEPATFAYVPMKFTKVTILPNSNTPNPYLYNLETDPHSGILKRTANGDNSAATPKIEYDMMVEVDARECPYDATKTNVYECERFYGNTCKEIYFKPQAQLRWQHYLTYERAWVDMELETNQWYTLAAPLNDLVAGDMYVPTTGRQETEAFKPITFGEVYSGKEYNRVTYPIYQRSWDKADSKVMTLSGGYNADIDYGTWGEIATTWSQWSHVYNDVDEKYEPGFGYSIRVHHTPAGKALIRLPKDDTGYNYFDYAGNVSNLHKDGIHSADGDEQYRLAADGVATGMLQLEVEENKTDANKYYLIGNPYMASLKMDLFFNGNQNLEKKYWVIVNGELKSASDETGLGVVGPTQSFFVKTVDGSPVSSITLSPLMTTSNLITTANVASSGQTNNAKIRMSATDLDGRKSNVTVVLNDKASNDFVDAEDVELLHDSNLENVPQLYTVAGNQTAMVNSMSGIDNLPIGVMTAKNETVALTVNTLYGINDVLYLYDAKNNVQTELAEGMELMMETNQHGRYFITTRAIAEKGNMTETKVNCYSPSQNLLVVSTTAGDMIKEISIYDASGRMVKADASVDNISASYNLPQGIYIVKVMTDCSAGEIVNKTQVR